LNTEPSSAKRGLKLANLPLLRPLRNRNFRLLWYGEGVSLIGDQFYLIALSWLTLEITGSGLALGTVLMAAAIPRALLMLIGGAVSDPPPPAPPDDGVQRHKGVLVAIIAALVFGGLLSCGTSTRWRCASASPMPFTTLR
jgi:hypothetical protein